MARRWLLPALALIAWLALGVVAGGYPGKLAEVQRNDGLSFLPATTEATEVVLAQERMAGGKIQPAVVVFSRDDGITEADLGTIAAAGQRVSTVAGVTGPVTQPTPSPDRMAVQFFVPVAATDGFQAGKTVERIREVLPDGLPTGLSVNVTGPGGFTADLGDVFSGLDGVLLLVTAAVVVVILVLVYRSPLLPIVVLGSAALALVTASLVVHPLAANGVLALSGQSQGILFILVFGASTDYALLLTARFREELAERKDSWSAITAALRASVESITASAGTVVLGLLCLLFSELPSNRGLGPIAAIGVVASVLTSLTFLPAALVLLGRTAFWPARPRSGHGWWDRVAGLVGRRFRPVWIGTALVLAWLAIFAPTLSASGVGQSDVFLKRVDAVVGQEVLEAHFPGAAGGSVTIVAKREAAPAVVTAARDVAGVVWADVGFGETDGRVAINAILNSPGESDTAARTVQELRDAVHAVPGANARVGGQAAIQAEIRDAAERDRLVIIPIALLVIFLVLTLLLRSVLAPLVLIATVLLSFGATLGVAALVFDHVLGFPGSDPSVPLYAFVFLVALGVDYNIFLMTRVREEAQTHGTRAGTLRALAVTGGVITSAGVVLAATFTALAVLPILFMAQISFLVAFGVLLDTFVVRSLLVPALFVHIGRVGWWPGELRHGPRRVIDAQREEGADRDHDGGEDHRAVETGHERLRPAGAKPLRRLSYVAAPGEHLLDAPGQDRAEHHDPEHPTELRGDLLQRGGEPRHRRRGSRDDDLGGRDQRDSGTGA
ncbi:MAG: MMPL family transporter [Umezawaea sp.]